MEKDTEHLWKGKMMSIRKTALTALVMIIILGVALSGCNPGVTTTTGNSTVTATATTVSAKTWYQQVTNELKALQPTLVPGNLISANGTKNGGEFDVNADFSVLKHLSMQEGFVLDYVYLSDGAAGGPILYIRPADVEPFKTYNEYRDATHQNPRQTNDKSMIWLVKGVTSGVFGNKISVQSNKEGYFEYALLQVFGNQFYLLGGAQINDKRIVCEKEEVEKIISEIESSGNSTMSDDFKKSARNLELNPEININENLVIVTFVTFSKWGGFSRYTLTMSRGYPNYIIDQKIEGILAAKPVATP